MFEQCNTLEELNRERIESIRSGNPSMLVNKEYAKRKAVLLSNQDRSHKKLRFVSVPLPTLETIIGVDNAWWEDENPYRIYIEEA